MVRAVEAAAGEAEAAGAVAAEAGAAAAAGAVTPAPAPAGVAAGYSCLPGVETGGMELVVCGTEVNGAITGSVLG